MVCVITITHIHSHFILPLTLCYPFLRKVVRHRAMEMTHDAIPSNDPLCEIMGITDKKEGEGIGQ